MKQFCDFNKLNYKRLDNEETKKEIDSLTEKIKCSKSFDEFLSLFRKIIDIQNEIEEMTDYADIRNMRNSKDSFFDEEMLFWNENKSKFDLLFNRFYEICLNTKFRKELSNYVPVNFFNTILYKLKTTSNEIIDLTKKENELKEAYKSITREKIIYDGEERNIPYITGFFSNKDRSIRKKAHDTINDFYYKKQDELDQIIYDLVNVRNEVAKKLGFNNYSTMSLYTLRRFGYNYKDIKKFRNYIIKYINPLCKMMNGLRKSKLKLKKIEYFDTIFFEEMPKLLYEDKKLLNEFGNSLKKIDKDLYGFYLNMLNNNYIDLENRDNKLNIYITNYLTKTGVPTITGNFKSTYSDVEVLAHEFGHSFQKYNASLMDRNYIVSPILKYPTFEIAEMFSHAMEIISMNYVDNLFNKEDYKKYCFMEIYSSVSSFPYICLVDEFQEKIYKKKDLRKEDIRKIWLKLVKKYGLETSNKGHINLDSGGYFYRQNHIFLNPFYYIDYALSYFGAFSIANACKDNLALFKKAASVASYYPLNELINKFDLPNPFDEKAVENLSKYLDELLEKYI